MDILRQELAQIQEKLIELPSDAFAERYELRTRQDELRDKVASFSQDRDADRSDQELLEELAALQARHKQIVRNRINLVGQSSGGSGAGPGAGAYGVDDVNRGIAAAAGASEIESRITRIKSILADRDLTS